MFWNNVKIALRNLKKNKLFAAINILGLALGLAVYVFGSLLADYERSHDLFFKNADRVYSVGTVVKPEAALGIAKIDSAHTALGPVLEAELAEVELVARSLRREYLIRTGEESFYQSIRFVDPAFTRIFDLKYVSGDANAIDDPSAVLISEAFAEKYFGKTDPIGKVITLDNKHDFHVAAVIENVPLNSHFNSTIINKSVLDILIPFQALARTEDFDTVGEWDNLSFNDLTYVLLPPNLNGEWLQNQVKSIFDRHMPETAKEYFSGFEVSRLQDANLAIWDAFGLPVMVIIKLLGLMVLIIACVNYTNLDRKSVV